MSCRLPVELIVHDIVDVIVHSDDVRSLANLALVCHGLHPYLFRHTTLHSPDRCHALFTFIQHHSSARDNIRSLTMEPGHRLELVLWAMFPIALLSALPKLHKLSWRLDDTMLQAQPVSVHPGMFLRIRTHLAHVDTLHFKNVTFVSPAEFARLLLAFPGLRHLCLSKVQARRSDALLHLLKDRLSSALRLRSLEVRRPIYGDAYDH